MDARLRRVNKEIAGTFSLKSNQTVKSDFPVRFPRLQERQDVQRPDRDD